MARLELEVDPSGVERGTQRAKVALDGVKKSALGAEKGLDALAKNGARDMDQLTAAENRAEAAADRLGSTVARSGGGFGSLGSRVQQASFQIGDFATQVGAGTSASVALGQQLPQLLGGFGALGAVMGAVVAIGVPLVAALIGSSDAAKTAKDSVEALTDATDRYLASSEAARTPIAELAETYGHLADEVQRAMENQTRQDFITQAAAQATAAKALLDQLTAVETVATGMASSGKAATFTQFRVLADDFGLADEKAQALVSSLETLASARGPDQVANAALQVQAALDGARDAAGNLPPPLAEAYNQLTQMIDAAGRTRGEIEKYPGILASGMAAARGMAAEVGTIAGAAASSAQALWDMVGAMGAARNAALAGANAVPGMANPMAAPDLAAEGAAIQNQLAGMRQRKVGNFAPPKGGSGGGGSGGGASEVDQIDKAYQSLIGTLDSAALAQQQFDAGQKTINEALASGIINSDQAKDALEKLRLKTLESADTIEGASARIQKSLQEAMNPAQQYESAAKGMFSAFESFFMNPVDVGLKGLLASVGQVIAQIAAKFLAAKLTGLLFPGGGGGIFAGMFDAGGQIPRGQYGFVAERRPELVNGTLVTAPSLVKGPARITGGQQTASMMGGGSGGSASIVVVSNEDDAQNFLRGRKGRRQVIKTSQRRQVFSA